MLKVMRTDLTPDELEVLELKKAIAVAQAKWLCRVYKTGQLREWLDWLKNIDKRQYISHSNHPQQKTEATNDNS